MKYKIYSIKGDSSPIMSDLFGFTEIGKAGLLEPAITVH